MTIDPDLRSGFHAWLTYRESVPLGVELHKSPEVPCGGTCVSTIEGNQ